MVAIADEKFELYEGKLHFFKQAASPYWYCGFHFKGTYFRKTTKCAEKSAAITFAERWWHLKQAEILVTGEPSKTSSPTVAQYAVKALTNLKARAARGERSHGYAKIVSQIINSLILPFFGKYALEKVDVVLWNSFVDARMNGEKQLSRSTLHGAKNALRLILNTAYRNGAIKNLPILKDNAGGPQVKVPRVWFDPNDYRKMVNALRSHRKTLEKTRWVNDADELYDYFIFNCNAGMRAGECRNVRFCDVQFMEDKNGENVRQYLLIKNIKGKRGTGECRTMDGAVNAYQNIIKRRGISNPEKSEELLFQAYHRDMFRVVLEKADLRFTKDRPPRKRDLTVCRHTYISFRLVNGANAFEVANNCRTSTAMIQEHYARWLSPRLTTGLNIRKKT